MPEAPSSHLVDALRSVRFWRGGVIANLAKVGRWFASSTMAMCDKYVAHARQFGERSAARFRVPR